MRRSLFGALAREAKSSGGLNWGGIDELWERLLGGWQSRSGVTVNWKKSLRVSAVLACARRIDEACSTVPWRLYQQTGNRRQPATGHPLFALLDSGPNEWQDSLQFREMLTLHAALAGAGYAFVNRVNGQIAEMIPLPPDRCTPKLASDRASLGYQITAPDGSTETVEASEVFCVRGLSWDGYKALDIVRLAREAIGLSLAVEQTHSMLHANGARPSGIVSVKGEADEARLIRLAAWVKRHWTGLENSSGIMVLDDDAKFTPLTMTGVDAQHIALRNHQIEEVCKFMGVEPIGFQ